MLHAWFPLSLNTKTRPKVLSSLTGHTQNVLNYTLQSQCTSQRDNVQAKLRDGSRGWVGRGVVGGWVGG